MSDADRIRENLETIRRNLERLKLELLILGGLGLFSLGLLLGRLLWG